MRRFVVDAGAALKWFIPEAHSAAAIRLLDEQIALAAPDLILPELADTLEKRVRRGDFTREVAFEILDALDRVPLELHPSAPLTEGALELALATGRSVRDCIYLALAVAHQCSLVTADKGLYAAAAKTPFAGNVRWIENEL